MSAQLERGVTATVMRALPPRHQAWTMDPKGQAVVISKAARKALSALQAMQRTRVSRANQSLGNDPRPQGVTKLSGAELYRIRVGDLRVVYAIDDTIRVVSVTSVGHRRDIYRNV